MISIGVTQRPSPTSPPLKDPPLPRRAQRVRHIYDPRSPAPGGGHFVECRCKATAKRADAETAIAGWRRINRPARSAEKPAAQLGHDNVLQMPLRLLGTDETHRRTHGSR